MSRVFDIDVETCPHCQGRVRTIAAIEDPKVIKKILEHLGLPTSPPRFHPTDPSLTSALKGYGRVIRISKKEQGLFADPQASVEFNRHMATHGVNQLRVAGVNGGACVRETILGAVERGFRVRAISDGIAEISAKYADISHPYRFGSTDPLVESPGTQFRQSVSRRIRSDFFESTLGETRSTEDVILPGSERTPESGLDPAGRC